MVSSIPLILVPVKGGEAAIYSDRIRRKKKTPQTLDMHSKKERKKSNKCELNSDSVSEFWYIVVFH